jgi:hypothetical protein
MKDSFGSAMNNSFSKSYDLEIYHETCQPSAKVAQKSAAINCGHWESLVSLVGVQHTAPFRKGCQLSVSIAARKKHKKRLCVGRAEDEGVTPAQTDGQINKRDPFPCSRLAPNASDAFRLNQSADAYRPRFY